MSMVLRVRLMILVDVGRIRSQPIYQVFHVLRLELLLDVMQELNAPHGIRSPTRSVPQKGVEILYHGKNK